MRGGHGSPVTGGVGLNTPRVPVPETASDVAAAREAGRNHWGVPGQQPHAECTCIVNGRLAGGVDRAGCYMRTEQLVSTTGRTALVTATATLLAAEGRLLVLCGRHLLLLLLLLGLLLNDALLLPGLRNEEVRQDAQDDEDRPQRPGRLLKNIRRLALAEHLAGGPARGDAGETASLPALQKHHQDEQCSDQRNEYNEERKHTSGVRCRMKSVREVR